MSAKIFTLGGLAVLFAVSVSGAVTSAPQEMYGKNAWISAKLNHTFLEEKSRSNELVVLQHGPNWWDLTQQNQTCEKKKLTLAGKTYARGLFCHSPHKLLVRLAAPAQTFSATLGVDDQANGIGTVIFALQEAGETNSNPKEFYRSPVIKRSQPPVPVAIDLAGAQEFVIRVENADGDINHDHAVLADAKVTLAGGQEIWLGDIPLREGQTDWIGDTLPAFSFLYNGKPSSDFLPTWKITRDEKKLDARRTRKTVTYLDSQTGLEVTCEAMDYADFPAVEWLVHFTNTAQSDTPILENIQALDMQVRHNRMTAYTLYHGWGADNQMHDFGLRRDTIAPQSEMTIGSQGTSSIQSLPFFNLEANKQGIIAAVGWSGNWSARLACDENNRLHLRAGMDSTRLLLHPGETIRTPRMLLLFWDGDRLRGHNLWRRLILRHYTPYPNGEILQAPLTDGNWGAMTAQQQIGKIKWWVDNDLPLDCFWIDAGWSGKTGPMDLWVENASTRVPNPELYPNGMKEVSDYARRHGIKFLLWMWPNRAMKGLEIGAEHPEWVLPGEAVDHGIPEINEWFKTYYAKIVSDYGLDIFRQDGNPVYPADQPDRQGINQIRHFTGFYEFWDYLLQQHPHLIIDNCSGGGRKIDLETTRRSISLWRSDYQVPNDFDPIGMQGQTYGLSFWVPLSGGCSARTNPAEQTDPYYFRSGYSAALCINWHVYVPVIDDTHFDKDQARRLLDEYRAVRQGFYGDYYPLTDYSVSDDDWMAWQFDKPETGWGMVQVFRRPQCMYVSAQMPLNALQETAAYELTNCNTQEKIRLTGQELTQKGLMIEMDTCPGSALFTYQKIN